MKARSSPEARPDAQADASSDWDELRAKIIGLGERSIRKSYYLELEQQLAELERFRALLNQSNDLIFLAEVPSGRFADVNAAACRQLGYTREALEGMAIGDLVPKPVAEQLTALFADTRQASQEGTTLITTFEGEDGDMPVEVSVRQVAFSDVIYAVIVARDITERKRGERLLLALGKAAQAVQRARTPEAVYQTIGEQIERLGLDVTIFTLSDDRAHLIVSHLTLQSKLVRAAENLIGVSAEGYRFVLKPDGFFQRVLAGGETVFGNIESSRIAEALPRLARPLAGRLKALLGWQQSIYAPLTIDDEVQGLLTIAGADLTPSDVPAITAFANQAAIALKNARLYREAQQLAAFNKSIIQSMNEGIVLQDAEGTLTFVNPKAAKMLGYAPQELVGLHWTAFIPPDQQPLVRAADRRRMRGEADRYELELVHKDGRRISILVSGSPRFDEAGDFAGTMAVFTDITERKRMEQALRESEARFRRVYENIAMGVAQVSMDFIIQSANEAYCKMLGYSEEELIGMHLKAITHPEIVEENLRKQSELASGRIDHYRMEKRFIHKQGHVVHGILDANLIHDTGGKPSYFIGTVLDITERKQAEEALRESEWRNRLVAEMITDYVFIVDVAPDGGLALRWASDNMFRLTGRTVADAATPDLWTDIIYPEDRPAFFGFIEELLTTGEAGVIECRTFVKSGTQRWIQISAQPHRDAGGSIVAIVGAVADITERKRAEEERERLTAQVREQARRLEHVLATVPAGVLLLNAEGHILRTNPVAEKDLAVLTDARAGDILTHLGDRPLASLLTSPPTKGLWHEVKADGHTFEVIARPVENGPRPEHWVLVTNDVTREREVQAQLRQQERLAAVGQLAAGIAHDFNNIMATIMLYAQMALRSDALSERDRERMAVVNQQAWHASRLIEQILDFSRRAVLERRPLDLLPLLKEQVRLLKRTLPEHIQIELDYEQDAYTVNADPTRIQQMLTNLAVNARDAMPEGGTLHIGLDQVTVEPGTSPIRPEMEAGTWVQITVSDTGMGIPAEALPHIFEPFFTLKEPGEGSGLGLAQVHGIVGQHGGHIDVRTRLGEGTTFTIYLPALDVDTAEPHISDTTAMPQGHGETILVVEDGDVVRAALVESLREWNYQTIEAVNGQQALALMEEQGEEVALVLSDVVMPVMGGRALLHALRDQGWQTPIILLTGHPMNQNLDELQAQGLTSWLTKPPSLEHLAQAIDDALRK